MHSCNHVPCGSNRGAQVQDYYPPRPLCLCWHDARRGLSSSLSTQLTLFLQLLHLGLAQALDGRQLALGRVGERLKRVHAAVHQLLNVGHGDARALFCARAGQRRVGWCVQDTMMMACIGMMMVRSARAVQDGGCGLRLLLGWAHAVHAVRAELRGLRPACKGRLQGAAWGRCDCKMHAAQ